MTFFNWLSYDIHLLIASKLLLSIESTYENGVEYIKREEGPMTLLAYAHINSDSRRAVMACLKYSLTPWHWRQDVLSESVKCFASELVEINLSHTDFTSFDKETFSFPKLRKAVIKARYDHLKFVKQGQNLVELKVIIESYYDWSSIISAIQALNLKSLELNYLTDRYQTLQDLSIEELMNLRDAFNSVENLTLKGHVELNPEIEYMISQFQILKKLCLEGEITDISLPCLRRIPELEFFNLSSTTLKTVSQLGVRVKGIKGLVAGAEDMQVLKSFPNLRELEIQPVQNLHEVLGCVMGSIEALTVQLAFDLVSVPALPGHLVSFYVVRRFQKLNLPVLFKILKKARVLTFLSLKNVLLGAKDVGAILKTAGKFLKHFHISIDWQHEVTAYRMFRILNAIAKYCPNLEELRFLEDDVECPMPILSTPMQKVSCVEALTEITQTAPNFKSFDRNMRFIQNRLRVRIEYPAAGDLTWDSVIPIQIIE